MQQKIKIMIPEGADLADLCLTRHPDGSLSFDWKVIERICEASQLPVPQRKTHASTFCVYRTHSQLLTGVASLPAGSRFGSATKRDRPSIL